MLLLCCNPYSFVQMPQLRPEDMSMLGLNLFTQLCSLARVADGAVLDRAVADDQVQ